MEPAVAVENLSKCYQVAANRGGEYRYRTLRESITEGLTAAWRGWRGGGRPAADNDFWALNGVSFDVQPGEVVGLIGPNGAGKSTLLKIISRIAKPSSGQVTVRGRVGSLLEVGTGFHPELTGRENIFLNGAILGMSRAEVARKFDEIVAFAEVERFLDTPVKRYSSGMYMRLAFAVASHLEPEILLVDEVLAVGDAQFQNKCLGRMSQVSRAGRTVLFVSHNMAAVKSLCSRAVLIDHGRVLADGDVDDVVNRYLTLGAERCRAGVIPEHAPRQQDAAGEALFRSVRLTDRSGQEVSQLYFGQPFRVGFRCEVLKDLPDAHFEVSISTLDGVHVTYATTLDGDSRGSSLTQGIHEVWAEFDVVLLPRAYTIDLGVHHNEGTTADFVPRTLDFTVLRVAESGGDHYRWGRTRGLVRAGAIWEHKSLGPRHPTGNGQPVVVGE
jgi:lipopolysaccharide transport system ATP-binding protein